MKIGSALFITASLMSIIALVVLPSIIPASALKSTTTNITPNPSSVDLGKTMTFKAKVTNVTPGTKSPPSGMVSWSDGGSGGHFSTGACTLVAATTSVSACKIVYTPSSGHGNVTITGAYLGDDDTFAQSKGTSKLTINHRITSTTVTPNLSSLNLGKTIKIKARVADINHGIKSVPTGLVSWSDGGAGGHFSSVKCSLVPATASVSACTVTYTPSSKPGSVIISAKYEGDIAHLGSSGKSGTSSLTVNHSTTTTFVIPNPSSNMLGKTIKFLAQVSDVNNGTKTAPAGMVSWADGDTGGVFSHNTCTLVISNKTSSQCNVLYGAPLIIGKIKITATYLGDTQHNGSFGISILTVS